MNFQINTEHPGLIVVNNLSRFEIIDIHLVGQDVKTLMHIKNFGGMHILVYHGLDGYADIVVVFKSDSNYFTESTEIYLSNSDSFDPDVLIRFGWKSVTESIKHSMSLAQPIGNYLYFERPDRFITFSGKSATIYHKAPRPIAPDTLVSRLIQLGKDMGDLEIAEEFNEMELAEKLREGINRAMKDFFPVLGYTGGMNQ